MCQPHGSPAPSSPEAETPTPHWHVTSVVGFPPEAHRGSPPRGDSVCCQHCSVASAAVRVTAQCLPLCQDSLPVPRPVPTVTLSSLWRHCRGDPVLAGPVGAIEGRLESAGQARPVSPTPTLELRSWAHAGTATSGLQQHPLGLGEPRPCRVPAVPPLTARTQSTLEGLQRIPFPSATKLNISKPFSKD